MSGTGGEALCEEIGLSRDETAARLFALDAAMERFETTSRVYGQLERAARFIVEKFLPDLPDL